MQSKFLNKLLAITLSATLVTGMTGLQSYAADDISDTLEVTEGEPESDLPDDTEEDKQNEEVDDEESLDEETNDDDETKESSDDGSDDETESDDDTEKSSDDKTESDEEAKDADDISDAELLSSLSSTDDGTDAVKVEDPVPEEPIVEEIKDTDPVETEQKKKTEAEQDKVDKEEQTEEETDEEIEVELESMASEYVDMLDDIKLDNEEVVNTYDINVPEGTEFPVQITFDADVAYGDDVMLYHYMDSEWETIVPDDVADGEITATFNHLSPVAVVKTVEEEEIVINAEYLINDDEAGYIEDNTAIAYEHYSFVNWTNSEDTQMTDDAYFVAEEDGVYTANFKPVEYQITFKVSDEEAGEIVNENNEKITVKDEIKAVKAQANEGYKFVKWVDADGNTVSEEAEFTPELKEAEYTAEFKEEAYSIIYQMKLTDDSTEPSDGQYGSVMLNSIYDEDTISDAAAESGLKDFDGAIARALEGYRFVCWTDEDGNEVSTDNSFIPSDITEDKTYIAVFESKFINVALRKEIDGHTVTAQGMMPRGAELSVEKVTITKKIEELVENKETENFTIYDAFDIKILVDGEVWQPVDDKETVKIEISAIELPENSDNELNNVQVHRIADEGDEVTKLNATVEDGNVIFDTEHFTIFTIGSETYNSNDADQSWDISQPQDGSIMAYWYEDDALLIITGSGIMKNYSHSVGTSLSPIYKNLGSTTFSVEWVDADGITNIGDNVFYDCTGLTLTSLPDGITSIGICAFQGCTNLALTSLPDGITSVENIAFADCTNLALTSLPDGLTSIGYSAFQGCTNLALTSLPDGLTSISSQAFYNCTGLTLTSLPDGITSIEDGAFSNCTGITEISYYGTLTSLGAYAFRVPTTLKTTLNTTDETLLNYDWEGSNRKIKKTLTVNGVEYDITDADSYDVSYAQDGSLTAYYLENDNIVIISGTGAMKDYVYNTIHGGEQSPIKDLSGYTVIWDDHGITSIGDYFFNNYGAYGTSNTAEFNTLPAGLTWIGQHAFGGCSNFNQAIPDSVTHIGAAAFQSCTSLAITSLPSSLTTLGNNAFYGCTALTEITIPSGITALETRVFQSCSALWSVTLASGTTSIGSYAFTGCRNLQTINNMDNVTAIGSYAFQNTAVAFNTLPAGLTAIGPYAFANCSGITTMTVNNAAITSLAAPYDTSEGLDGLFYGCSNLTSVDFSGWDMSSITSTKDIIKNTSVSSLTGPAAAPSDSAELNGTYFEKDEHGVYVSTKCYAKLDQTVGKSLTKEAFVYSLSLPATAGDMTQANNILTKNVEYNITFNGDDTKKLVINPGSAVTLTAENGDHFDLALSILAADQNVSFDTATLNGDADTAEHYYTKTGVITATSPDVATLASGDYVGNIQVAWATQDK